MRPGGRAKAAPFGPGRVLVGGPGPRETGSGLRRAFGRGCNRFQRKTAKEGPSPHASARVALVEGRAGWHTKRD
jgi:hypothetical protein